MIPNSESDRSQEELMSIYGLCENDSVIFVQPGLPVTYKGLLQRDDDNTFYVQQKNGSRLPFLEGWLMDPSILYSEANLRKILDVWGVSDINEAVEKIAPEIESLLGPGDE